jgi:hypothetical protein
LRRTWSAGVVSIRKGRWMASYSVEIPGKLMETSSDTLLYTRMKKEKQRPT